MACQIPPADNAQLAEDEMLYGTSVKYKCHCGVWHRVEPANVILRHRKTKEVGPKAPAQALYEELGKVIEHAESVIVYARSKQGNDFLMESSNVTREHLQAAKRQIQEVSR